MADVLDGRVFEFGLSPTFSTAALAIVAVPGLMVVLSTMLPARANRLTNLVVAALSVPVTAFNVMGESWLYFYGLDVVLELALLALVLRHAWTWPRTPAPRSGAAGPGPGSRCLWPAAPARPTSWR